MSKIIGYCGLVCDDCPGYKATLANDDVARKKVALEWTELYGQDILPEHINCNGCTKDYGPKIPYCSACEIRKCAHSKNVASCAYCKSYPCDLLEKFFESVPEAKDTLDSLKLKRR